MPRVSFAPLNPDRFPCPTGLRRALRPSVASGAAAALEIEVDRAWAEALSVLRMGLWRRCLGFEEFLERFAPHAEASRKLMARLEGSREVWLLAATAGVGISEAARERFQGGRLLSGYLLDRMGGYLADRGMRHLARNTEELARRRGLVPGRRYSPGYADFSLEAQGPLVTLAQEELPELGLTAGFMLVPEKSVTAVLGVGSPA